MTALKPLRYDVTFTKMNDTVLVLEKFGSLAARSIYDKLDAFLPNKGG